MTKVKALIAGTYTWTHSYRYLLGYNGIVFQDTITPQKLSLTRKYVFTKNGNSKYIEDDQVKFSYTYSIDYGYNASKNQTDSATVVILKNPQTNDQLHFYRPFLCNSSAKFYHYTATTITEEFYTRN